MNHSARVRLSLLLFTSASAAVLAFCCGRFSSLPQVSGGDDVLSVAFGDAREVISRAAVEKADSYFHGGIDMDGGDEVEKRGGGGEGADWWSWIDSRIRAPQEHRHLEGAKAVELMPWFWAAVKADPHNAEVWSTTWYTARQLMKDEALAARVLAEAKEKNPDSIEIAFTEGRAFYDGGKGDLAAARRAFARTRALGDAKCGGDVSKLTVREEEAYRFAGNYLKNLDGKKP